METLGSTSTPWTASANRQQCIDEFVTLFRSWRGGRRAITIGGSVGKGLADEHSDLDFRIFHEDDLPWPDRDPASWKPLWPLMEKWNQQGIKVDGVWPRRISDIDAQLTRWIEGNIDIEPKEWSIWGYHLPTDIFNQYVIDDEVGIIARWKQRLMPYPPKLKAAILKKHGSSLRYWRQDYHYANKVARGDVVFLAGLAARLVHDIMQVLFALNETFFPGDGANVKLAEHFAIKPSSFAERVRHILQPQASSTAAVCDRQYRLIVMLIDDVLPLMSSR